MELDCCYGKASVQDMEEIVEVGVASFGGSDRNGHVGSLLIVCA